MFNTTKGGDLTLCLSNSIDIELITNIIDSKRKFVFRTTKRRVLTLLLAKSNEFERISVNFDMQAYLDIYTSRIRRNEQIVFRTTNTGDLAPYLFNSIDIELIANIVVSKRRFVFRTTKRCVLTFLFAKSNELKRISTNIDKQAYFEI